MIFTPWNDLPEEERERIRWEDLTPEEREEEAKKALNGLD